MQTAGQQGVTTQEMADLVLQDDKIAIKLLEEVILISPRPVIQKCIDKLSQANYVCSMTVGPGGQISEVYDWYLGLYYNASLDELRALLMHASPVIRCWAFSAIVDQVNFQATLREEEGQGGISREDANTVIFSALLENITNREPVDTMFGCCWNKRTVSDILMMYAEPHLTPEQVRQVNDLLPR